MRYWWVKLDTGKRKMFAEAREAITFIDSKLQDTENIEVKCHSKANCDCAEGRHWHSRVGRAFGPMAERIVGEGNSIAWGLITNS